MKNIKINIDDLFKKSGLKICDVIGLCPYGSRVYGTADINSDYDFLVIVHDKKTEQWSDGKYNLSFETLDSYQDKLWNHDVVAIETHYSEWIIKKFKPVFKLDLVKIRHSFSGKASNSWVKAYKKLSVEKDYDLKAAQKSLFHSLRILDFGIQLGTSGKIDKFDISNHYWLDIKNISDWSQLKDKYKEIYNQKSTEFRKVCPK